MQTAQLTGTVDGRTWELVRRAPIEGYALGDRYCYLVRVGGIERWATRDSDLDTAVRELDNPDQLASERKILAEREAETAREVRAVNELRTRRANRATELDATAKRVYIRFGHARPGTRSANHRDGGSEAGLSVYSAWRTSNGEIVLDLRGVDTASFLFGAFTTRTAYLATGALAGTGSDGEPILTGHRLRKVGALEPEVIA